MINTIMETTTKIEVTRNVKLKTHLLSPLLVKDVDAACPNDLPNPVPLG
jgi:hypothetical protein